MKKTIGISLLVLVLLMGFAGCSSSGGKEVAKVNYEQYMQINLGMSYEEVCNLIGAEGEAVAEPEDETLKEYTWEAEAGQTKERSFILLGFREDVLVKKVQAGVLKEDQFDETEPRVDADKLAGITAGMPRSEVEGLVGSKGKLSSEILLDGGKTQTEYMYLGEGVDESAYVLITYVDDAVTDIYQNGIVKE
jgi:hypothetical protein